MLWRTHKISITTSRCYNCGKVLRQNEVTIDHIPPRCLVTQVNWSKLIKVHACATCNLGRSKDDENFRNWLTTGAAGSNLEAKEIYITKIKKSWDRRPAIKSGLRQRLRKADLYTPAGLYLGEIAYAHIEEERAVPVLDSIAKGILWHHFNYLCSKFPFGSKPVVFHNPRLDSDWMRFFLDISVPEMLIPGVFDYRFGHLPVEDGDLFHVFAIFYDRELFYIQYLMERPSTS